MVGLIQRWRVEMQVLQVQGAEEQRRGGGLGQVETCPQKGTQGHHQGGADTVESQWCPGHGPSQRR